jgi:hypothetical protein
MSRGYLAVLVCGSNPHCRKSEIIFFVCFCVCVCVCVCARARPRVCCSKAKAILTTWNKKVYFLVSSLNIYQVENCFK